MTAYLAVIRKHERTNQMTRFFMYAALVAALGLVIAAGALAHNGPAPITETVNGYTITTTKG